MQKDIRSRVLSVSQARPTITSGGPYLHIGSVVMRLPSHGAYLGGLPNLRQAKSDRKPIIMRDVSGKMGNKKRKSQ